MKKTVIVSILFFSILYLPVLGQAPQVPQVIDFAGLTLKLNDAARKDIQADVDAQYRSATHFQTKLDRVNLYMPIIERVLREEGVPDDFKFLAIQESSLISDAVSTSNAVGFWQFKKGTAEEVFLRVDNEVDERKSIVSSTRGAAKYLKKHQRYMENWATTLVSYQMGLGGARGYYKDKYKGQQSMDIDRNTYWYLKKFLAHKIAYQGQLGKMVSNGSYLHEYPIQGPSNLKSVAKTLGVSENHLQEYNKWSLKGSIPNDRTYTVTYILKGIVPERPLLASDPPSTKDSGLLPIKSNALGFPKITENPKKPNQIKINGIKGVVAISNNQSQLAIQAGISEGKLRRVNDLKASDPIQAGGYYYIKNKKSKAKTPEHIVQPGETLWEISQLYGIRKHSLMAKNRVYKDEQLLPGMVLRLRKYYKKNEAIARVKLTPAPVAPARTATQQKQPQRTAPVERPTSIAIPVPDKKPANTPKSQIPVETKTNYREHQVKPGDTLYSISRNYGVTVLELRNWNNISEDNILSVGQKLEIRK
ncbi:LysM peptidoglycan-binding domain-containing protein [uncultured Cyclobacterium sp.]|uniref:LysM peptidoglycan-binding domain-containing protein n=1 Tax=uncultured Cyclobacterium sp. TaxID=453820 RepID=UPI0030EB385F|tara:strand:+ start:8531 stop:10129 length:1599 start_codon:yes stop_codon:yes gene_type:complete